MKSTGTVHMMNRRPAGRALTLLSGTWRTEGQLVGVRPGPSSSLVAVDRYEWLPGLNSLAHYVAGHLGRKSVASFEIWSYVPRRRKFLDDDHPSQGGHNMIATKLESRAAIVVLSTALILPFAVLELVNNRAARSDFPVALFGFMWLNALALTTLIVSISRTLQSPGRHYTVSLAVRALTAIALAWMGVAGIVDQMPCFLGVPNCD